MRDQGARVRGWRSGFRVEGLGIRNYGLIRGWGLHVGSSFRRERTHAVVGRALELIDASDYELVDPWC